MDGYFGSVVGGDTTTARKPDALPLITCLQQLVARPEASLMIGDSAVDVNCARAAGTKISVVPWGYTSTPAKDLCADFILINPTILPKILNKSKATPPQTTH